MDGFTRSRHRFQGLRPRLTGAAVVALWLALPFAVFAQESPGATIRGVVVDPDGHPVAGVRVTLADRQPVSTDVDGRFAIATTPGEREVRLAHPAFRDLSQTVRVGKSGVELELTLRWAISAQESITVVGIRADDELPVTKTDLSDERVQELSFGQDVPAVLEVTPSVTSYSESGSGSNYSYFSIRGVQQTRINITYDGAPLNDPAEHALYFNNFHDLTSAVAGIQIQRGVGTSSVGAPSYGGSVNFASPAPAADLHGDVRLMLGSFGTRRATAGLESGTLAGGFSLGGRLSLSDTDGYRNHSGSEHGTFFFNGGWQDERTSLRLTGFTGNERSQMSFLAVEAEVLAENPRFNPLDEAERDDFGQDLVQLKLVRATGDHGLLTASVYYNGADGFFLLWDDPVAHNDLLEFGIDQHFWGSMVTYSGGNGRLWSTVGVHYNDFSGDHTLDVGPDRLYRNTGLKQTANGFAKAELRLGDTLLFGDLGLRWARFSYEGSIDLGSVDWLFFDPRIGVRRRLADDLSLYASVGRAQREPARLDLLAGEDDATVPHDLEAVRPESVIDIEAGVYHRSRSLDVRANVYAMEFRDEIALTGELSNIGLPLRRNADRSYRRGIEIDARWRPAAAWSVLGSLNVSHNRIRSWTQFTDVFDRDFTYVGSEPLVYRDIPPALSPERIANLGVEWTGGAVRLAGSLRHVGPAQLDNTGLERFRIPAWTNVDLRADVALERWIPTGRPRLRIFVNNLFDEVDHYASGYSYQFLVQSASARTLDGIRYFYPLADRHMMATLEVDF